MTNERHAALMGSDDLPLTADEVMRGYHFCHEFDGLLRTNSNEEFECDCLKPFTEATTGLVQPHAPMSLNPSEPPVSSQDTERAVAYQHSPQTETSPVVDADGKTDG